MVIPTYKRLALESQNNIKMYSKGSNRRPTDEKTYQDNYEKIFGKPKKENPNGPKESGSPAKAVIR